MLLHVSSVIGACAQTICNALRILHSHCMCTQALQHIYRSGIIAKRLYAMSAWWGFASAADRQCLQATVRCSIHFRLCDPGIPTFQTYYNKPKSCTVSVASSSIYCSPQPSSEMPRQNITSTGQANKSI